MIQINANCSGAPTGPVELVIDNGHRYPCVVTGSRLTVLIVPPEPSPFGAAIVSNGQQLTRLTVPPPGAWEADQPPVNMTPHTVAFGPVVAPTSKLATGGRNFLLNGDRWIWKGSTEFQLYQHFLNGRDNRGIYAQRRDAGATLLRVSGMYNGGIGSFVPSSYGQAYWDGLQPFLSESAAEGFQVEFTAFMDCQNIPEMHSTSQQQAHWGRLGSTLQPVSNVVVELVNEYPQNGVDPSQFGPLAGLLCARGSNVGDEPPPLPGWNYHTWHGRRDWPKVLFSSEDMWYVGEGWGPAGPYQYPVAPITHDEPIGFDEVDQPGRRSNDPYVARVLGQTSSAYGAGGTFHSSAGITSDFWGPRTEVCARAFFAASV